MGDGCGRGNCVTEIMNNYIICQRCQPPKDINSSFFLCVFVYGAFIDIVFLFDYHRLRAMKTRCYIAYLSFISHWTLFHDSFLYHV